MFSSLSAYSVSKSADNEGNARDDPLTTRGALSHNYAKNSSPLEELAKLVNTKEDFFEKFHLGDKISNGAFGAVYEVPFVDLNECNLAIEWE